MSQVLVLAVALALTIALSIFKRQKTGTFLGMPYNLEWPTPARIKQSVWDANDQRVMTPQGYGWGYSVNLHAVARRLGLV